MKTTLNIKNFRVFDENGVTFELNPITILTGSNSSGKSTIVKAAFLLNSFLSQIKKAKENGDPIRLDKYKLDFTTYPNNLLGRFDKVVHEGSDSKAITLEYTIHSCMLSKEVTVQLIFSADENDELNNGYLQKMTMSTEDGVFYSTSKKESYCNLNIIKEDGIRFLLQEIVIEAHYGVETNHEIIGEISEEEYQEIRSNLDKELGEIEESRIKDMVEYLRFNNPRMQSLSKKAGVDYDLILNASKKESIFSLPLIDKIGKLSKKEFESFLKTNILSNVVNYSLNPDDENEDNSDDIIFASNKVMSAFKESKQDFFEDFVRDYEKLFLEKINCISTTSFFHGIHRNGIALLHANELDLICNYLPFEKFTYCSKMIGKGGLIDNVKTEEQARKEWEESDNLRRNRKLDFEIISEVLMIWNKLYNRYKDKQDDLLAPSEVWSYEQFKLIFKILAIFAEKLVLELILPDWSNNISYVTSDRVHVKRLYSLDNNDDFSKLLKNYFESKRLYLNNIKNSRYAYKKDYEIDSFINSWIEKFEIGKAISFIVDKEGLGVQILLHKSKDDEGRLLADEGYGITQIVSVLLQIETAILSAKGVNFRSFGVSKRLDDYNENKFHYEINTIAIEEPEIHLHPKYQSLLADMFLEAYEKYNIHFLVETHSEYLIRKAQVFVAHSNYENEEAMSKENPFMIYYVPRGEKPYEMTFCADGRFKNEFGKGFFDEATNLAFEIL